ncbi:hypothetical protein QO009_004099 [Brevibacillus aydinogluensis]|jgi:hypothetical protein|uniref:hypothetical protein n=1 Tax=Brevibacillus aydinogluensis TaxID=927786 RepID=UPI002893834A|nr:hypothetical protein [Brevibacillus aydinogluensis]MDT3418174.1 hypothetical protein [Brevibacillus aydinogluensis]
MSVSSLKNQSASHAHSQRMQWVEEYFRLMLGTHMNEKPRQRIRKVTGGRIFTYDKRRPWVFLGTKESMKAAATFSTLFNLIWDPSKDTTFYTPNSFYRNDIRRKSTVRWINALTIDIDVKPYQAPLSVQDVLDRCEEIGLPYPTIIVSTPSGGFHITWVFDQSTTPVRATFKTIALFEAIQYHVAADFKADLNAVGVERIFRTPSADNIRFFNPVSYPFQLFIDWRQENHPYVPGEVVIRPSFKEDSIMEHPAIRKLYNQDAVIGTRDRTCFTLVLAMKFSGYSEARALEEMETWYHECCEKGGPEPFLLKDVYQKVRYVYSNKQLRGPGSEAVRELTGLPFTYALDNIRYFTLAKPRDQRKRVHFSEWKSDLLNLLVKEEGKITGTIGDLAGRLACPISTFKHILKELSNEGVIGVSSTRGRNGSTTITLTESTEAVNNTEPVYTEGDEVETSEFVISDETNDDETNDLVKGEQTFGVTDQNARELNGQSHITQGEEVGGAATTSSASTFSPPGSVSDLIKLLDVLNGPYPASLPIYLHDLYRDAVAVWSDHTLDPVYAQDAATHTWLIVKKTLMDCLRQTKRGEIKSLTAYVRKSMEASLLALEERGVSVDRLPSSMRKQMGLE